MKKIATLFLALMLALSLVACIYEPSADPSDDADTSGGADRTEERDDNTAAESTDKNEITFTEAVVVDNEECQIKITGIETDNMWGYTLKAQLENKSAEKTYMFAIDSAALNGVECSTLFAEKVAPGKKANEEINFFDDDLKKNGVGEYTDVTLSFRVYDSDDWSADAAAEETVHIYPYGEDKATKFDRETKPSDDVLLDNDFVTVIAIAYGDETYSGYAVSLFLVNKTDKNVMFSVDEASVNGFMIDPLFATSLGAGNSAFTAVSWLKSDLDENKITQVEQIEMKIRAHDADDWRADDFVDETVTLNP